MQSSITQLTNINKINSMNKSRMRKILLLLTIITLTWRDIKADSIYGNDPLHVKVLVLNFDPIVPNSGGQTLQQYIGWNNPRTLSANHIQNVRQASGGFVQYEIAEWRDLNAIPVKQDGFSYTIESYLQNRTTGNWHSPDTMNYVQTLNNYNVPNLINSGAIDEVWLFGAPYFGYWESSMSGPGAFFINGGTYPQVQTNKPFAVMGFNYERGDAEMLHSLGHRMESSISRYFGGWNLANPQTDWDKFTANAAKTVNGTPGVGDIHFPANGLSDYDYGNPTPILSTATDWLNYPNLTGATTPISAAEWGGTHEGYMKYWFSHLPNDAGLNSTNNHVDNWWKYAYDWTNYNVNGSPISVQKTWRGGGANRWTSSTSWNNDSVPNSSTNLALFSNVSGTSSQIFLDANQTVNSLTFDSTNNYSLEPLATQVITLAGTKPTISTTAVTNTGTQTVAVALILGNGTTINANGGTLALNVPTNSVLGTGVRAYVGLNAQLSLGGTANALSDGNNHVNVVNNGTLAATTVGKRVGNIDGTGTTMVTTAGATLTANHIRQATLSIGAGNTFVVAPNGGSSGMSTVTNLSINATGKLDLYNNDLIVDNGNLTVLTALLASGLDILGAYGGGPGITSTSFATNPNLNTVLGIASNADLSYTTFSGQTVDANDVLIKYTYYGDADLNGLVDTLTDFDLYITGLTSGGSLGSWLFGDFDYNGTIDSLTDFDLYITGLTNQGAPLLTAGGEASITAVPEPSTFVLAGISVAGFYGLRLRRRRIAAPGQ